MDTYQRNRACDCARCRCAGYTGPAMIITIGVLFLVAEFTRFDFHETWPVILIVIGVLKVLQWSAPAAGHVSRAETGAASGYVPPPPPGGNQPPQSNDSQVPHG